MEYIGTLPLESFFAQDYVVADAATLKSTLFERAMRSDRFTDTCRTQLLQVDMARTAKTR